MKLIPILTAALLAPVFPAMSGAFEFFEPVDPPRPFRTIVHRGESGQAPENTRPALERCVEDMVEWAEVDVRLARDGRHVLAHGAALVDSTGRSMTVSDQTVAELATLDLGGAFAARYRDQRVVTLAEALAMCRGRLNLYLDCKAVDPARLAQEILEARMEKQVAVYGPTQVLARVREAGGGRLALMAKWQPGMEVPGWATQHGLAAVEIDSANLTAEVCAGFHGAGIKVETKLLDEADVPGQWERAVAAGADWLQTDRPEELLFHLRRMQLPRWPVRLSLHRGASRYAPENTLPAFAKARVMGVDFVEFDVRASRDGRLFLLHDGRLDRTSDGHGPMNDQTAEALARLDAGAWFGRPFVGTRIPTFEAFLAAFPAVSTGASAAAGSARPEGVFSASAPNFELYCDAKAVAPEALNDILRRHGRIESTVVYQSPDYLARLRVLEPALRRMPPLGKVGELSGLLDRVQPYAVDADWDALSAEVIARCHGQGVRVFSDALGAHERVDDYLKAIEWGIDLIQTDHPLRVLRAIEIWLR